MRHNTSEEAALDSTPGGGPDTALTNATLFLAGVTFIVAVVPILIRLWDIRRFKKAGRLQLDIILRNVEVRISTLVKNPRYSKSVLLAGIDVLFTRALSSDFAEVCRPQEMSRVYAALSSAYEVIVSAVEQERYLKEAIKEAPVPQTAREQTQLRDSGHRLFLKAAETSLLNLRRARALLKDDNGIRGILFPADGVKALRNPFVQGFR